MPLQACNGIDLLFYMEPRQSVLPSVCALKDLLYFHKIWYKRYLLKFVKGGAILVKIGSVTGVLYGRA